MAGPVQPGRVTGEIASFQVGDEPGADVVALVLGVEELAVDHAVARRRTEPGGPRLHGAILADAQGPAAPRHRALTAPPARVADAEGDVERDEQAAVRCDHRSEGVLVVMAGKGPGVDGFEYIGPAVPGRVGDFRQFASLRGIEGAVAPGESEGIVQAAGEQPEVRLGAPAGGVFHDEQFAAPGGHPQVPVRQGRKAAHLQFDVGRYRQGSDPVVVIRGTGKGGLADADGRRPCRQCARDAREKPDMGHRSGDGGAPGWEPACNPSRHVQNRIS